MKKKLIILLSALMVLSGCGKTERGEGISVNLIKPASSSASSSSSAASSSSSAASSSASAAASSSSTESSSSSSEEVLPAAPAENPPVVPDETEAETYVYGNDPQNPCTITFKDGKVTVNGSYGDLVSDIYLSDFGFDVEYGDGEGLNCTLSLPYAVSTQYTSFAILDRNRHINKIWVKISGGGIELANAQYVVDNNDNVNAHPTDLAKGRTARYITVSGYADGAPEVLARIKQLSDEICEGIDSDYEKLRAISYWVAENIYYDYAAFDAGIPQYCLSLEHMLDTSATVCGGYSNMTAALCAAQGIRCLNIKGQCALHSCYAQGGGGDAHEWNVAYAEGREIIIDSCWNSGNVLHTNGSYEAGSLIYKYFDIGREIFAQDHLARTSEYRDFYGLFGE